MAFCTSSQRWHIWYELWRSDGTSSGTFRVSDINPGPAGSYLSELTNVNATYTSWLEIRPNGRELWISNGTASGTVLVKDIQPGTSGSYASSLVNANGTLMFPQAVLCDRNRTMEQ